METERLIEEVRKYPVLYDQSDAKYRHAEYKEKVWKIISKTLKVPGGLEECKRKWASIRDQFRRTLQKRKKKSGQPAAKIQKYKYEEVLEFLLPHIVDKETNSNFPSIEDKRDNPEFDPKLEEPELDPKSEPESENEVSQCPGTSSQTIVQPTSPVHSACYTQAAPGKKLRLTRPVKIKRNGFKESAHESASSRLMAYILANKETKKTRINSTNPPQHPVDIFLSSLAPTLKFLDPVLLNQAKTAIFSTVQDFELKQLAKCQNHQQTITNPLRLDTVNLRSFPSPTGSSPASRSSSIHESPHYNYCSTSLVGL